MKKILPVFLSALVSAFLAVFIYAKFFASETVIYNTSNGDNAKLTSFAPPAGDRYVIAAPTDFVEAASKVTKSVVHIKSLSKSYDWWGSANYASSSGSGVIISDEGYIVTNNHVIEDANDIEVTLDDKRTYEAELIGTDPSTDLALIKIKAPDLKAMKFADSDNARVGEWVLAVGNPLSLTSTVTAGIISAKGRNIEILENRYAIESFIQTDAAVNPGNSGGALVNTNGDLVGINTAIITKSGRYEGYSFAVPSNLVKKVVSDLREFGKVQRGLLNVIIEEVNQTSAEQLELPSVGGVYIRVVNPGGAAEAADLRAGDVIVGVNGRKINTIPELQEAIGRFRPGDKVTLEYFRNGDRSTTSVVLKDRYNSTSVSANAKGSSKVLTGLGFELRDLTSGEKSKMRTSGAKVISVIRNSRIDATNMDPGYIITKVNETEVSSVDDVIQVLQNVRKGKKVMLEGFYEDYPDEYFYAFRME